VNTRLYGSWKRTVEIGGAVVVLPLAVTKRSALVHHFASTVTHVGYARWDRRLACPTGALEVCDCTYETKHLVLVEGKSCLHAS
jgi:hypothetical protein